MARAAVGGVVPVLVMAVMAWPPVAADTVTMTLTPERWRPVSPTLYSVFVEDISYGVTGGLNADMMFDASCTGGAGHLAANLHRPTTVTQPYHHAAPASKDRRGRTFRTGTAVKNGAWGGWNYIDSLDGRLAGNVTVDTMTIVNANISTSFHLVINDTVPPTRGDAHPPILGAGTPVQAAQGAGGWASDDPGQFAATTLGLCNWGYWGMTFLTNTVYNVSFFIRAPGETQLWVTLEGGNSTDPTSPTNPFQLYAATPVAVPADATGFQRVSVQLVSSGTETTGNGRVCYRFPMDGEVWIAATSLQPAYTTWNGRPNGMRADLAQFIADLRPGYLRFPGGDFVNGHDWPTSLHFNGTVGPLETRMGHMNYWNYWASDRAGLFEFLQFAEDVGMQPLWVLHAGVYGYPNFPADLPPHLQPWIDLAIGSLDFVLGDATTTYWGGVRASMGHPAPFDMAWVALGNEDCYHPFDHDLYENYTINYPIIHAAIRARYPDLRIVANCNMTPFALPFNAYDSHDYYSGDQAATQLYALDWTPRIPGAPMFMSEFSNGEETVYAAAWDGAWMIAAERNSDLVAMTCYAPFFVNDASGGWYPSLVHHNTTLAYGIPSYHVLRMFRDATPDNATLIQYNLTSDGSHVPSGTPLVYGNFTPGTPLSCTAPNITASALVDDGTGDVYVKVVSFLNVTRSLLVTFAGGAGEAYDSMATMYMVSGDPGAGNSLDQPTNVTVATSIVTLGTPITLPPFTTAAIHITAIASGAASASA